MIHAVFVILKVLGLILFGLLGLLLVVLLSILFVPVRYQIRGKKPDEGWEMAQGNLCVSWMLHLVHFRVGYQEKVLDWECFLLGIPLKKMIGKWKSWKKKRNEKKKEKRIEKRKKMQRKASHNRIKKQAEQKIESKKESEKTLQTEQKGSETKQQNGTKVLEQKVSQQKVLEVQNLEKEIRVSFWKRWKEKGLQWIRLIRGIPGKIKKKREKIRLTFRSICDKIRRWRTLWNEECTQEALRFLTERGKRILHHMLPRKIRGSVVFGFEDPSVTGQVLGAAAIFYPIYGKNIQICPSFEKKVLTGEGKMRGRLILGYLLWQAWKIYRNLDVRTTWKKIR